MHTWRFIDSGVGSAQWNMAVDEALLYAFKDDDLPILRLYRWEEPSLSFGRFSHPKEVIDWDRLRSRNIPYVRRITGGGILVHGDDISYTLIVPRSFIQKKGIKKSYRHLCAFLIHLYQNLGLDANFAHDLQVAEAHSALCLAGTEAYDIMIGGRKIGGNAQRHTRYAMLQHGTIPLRIDSGRFNALFLEDPGISQAATLEGLHIDTTEAALTEEVLKAFYESFGTKALQEPLSDKEQALTQKLFDEKYSREEWNVHAENTIFKA
ncbi:MAG: hypothetical protein P794_05995 [Epsilonproteobacteria bacterium (ex Lamellibrachia satsuma)]|nr:MAG: hypothetical protein P794_05995 [Epsilonproteobacteria bacterium (ex Lamellibrachia satsuma)]